MRAVGLVITLVTVVTFASVVYSAYSVASGVVSLGQKGSQAIQVGSSLHGSSATIDINATLSNSGLLPLSLSASCSGLRAGISCSQASLTILPHQQGTLRFQVFIANATQFVANPSGLHVNGTIRAELVPFASLSVTVDIGQLLAPGGK
jgi:hypothetical protein